MPEVVASSRIKAVLFDLGNVLIDFDHRIAMRALAGLSPKPPEEIFNLIFDSELTGSFEEGVLAPEEFFLKIKAVLDLKISYETFVPIWNEIFFFSEKNFAVYTLASCLAKNYKVSVLSNINSLHLSYIQKTFPLFNLFPIITSCELGTRKPDPKAYQLALERVGVAAAECFYTDDRAELIARARGMGIRGYTFTGSAQLKKDLLDNGVRAEAL